MSSARDALDSYRAASCGVLVEPVVVWNASARAAKALDERVGWAKIAKRATAHQPQRWAVARLGRAYPALACAKSTQDPWIRVGRKCASFLP